MLTERAKKSIERSFDIAKNYPAGTKNKVTATHLFYALFLEKGSLANNILKSHNIKEKDFSKHFEKTSKNKKKQQKNSVITLSASYKTALKKAAKQAMSHEHPLIGTEHLLYGVVTRLNSFDNIPTKKILNIKNHLDDVMAQSIPLNSVLGISHDKNPSSMLSFEKEIMNILEGSEEGDEVETGIEIDSIIKTKKNESPKDSILDNFCDDLTEKAKNKKLDPLVGREKELARMIRILARRNKNNPLLVGDAGVGKTALAGGLAQRIVDGNVPNQLENKRVLALDLSTLLSGTAYRGEFEERMHELIDEASKEDVILFIDEIHMIVGAGAAQGSLDAANILKPALVHGDFQCIGATTYEEFKKTIEKDSALDRRFQKVLLKEQTSEEAFKTLKKLKPYYENHHGVLISDKIIKLCIDLSIRSLPSRTLPDKALDILDESASYAGSEETDQKKNKEVQSLKNKLKKTRKEKDNAIDKEQYKKALTAKKKQDELEIELERIEKDIKAKRTKKEINEKHVLHVVSDMTGIPVNALARNKENEIEKITKELTSNVVGQNEALDKIIKTIKRNRSGVRSHARPTGSFLFLGPSGTGKTFTAKVLASAIAHEKPEAYRNPDTLIKIDMSEFSEAHSIARLIGAPPGYIGHEEAGMLVDKIRRNPYSVILFDEIEKAHPQIFNVLLQMLEDGNLTDSHGKTADLKNCFIILTSNVGNEHSEGGDLGFSSGDHTPKYEVSKSSLKSMLRPEIINRMDNVITFNPLNRGSLRKIARTYAKQLSKHLKEVVTIKYDSKVYTWIIERAEKEKQGARGIRRIMESEIEEPIAEIILSGPKDKKILVGIKKDKIHITNES